MTTICVKEDVLAAIQSRKLHPRESNSDCLKRVLESTGVMKDTPVPDIPKQPKPEEPLLTSRDEKDNMLVKEDHVLHDTDLNKL